MTVTASIIGGELYPAKVLRDGAVGYWRLADASGNALDSSGNARTLTVTGSPTYAQAGVLADGNQAVSFPGGGTDRFSRNDVALRPTTAVSFELWYKPSSFPAITYLGGCGSTGFAGYRLSIDAAGPAAVFNVSDGSAVNVTPNGGVLIAGTWYHLVGTHDGSTARLYLNGTQIASLAASFSIGYGAVVQFVVAQLETTSAARQATGVLDEVAVYPTALTARQITEHYGLRLAVLSGLTVSGAAVQRKQTKQVGSGGLKMGGAAVQRKQTGIIGSGGLRIGGSGTTRGLSVERAAEVVVRVQADDVVIQVSG